MGASLMLAPGILMTVVLGPVAGRLFDRHGGRVMIPVGFAIMAVFALLVGVSAGHEPMLLFGALYVISSYLAPPTRGRSGPPTTRP